MGGAHNTLSFRAERLIRRLSPTPIVAGALDVVENVGILFMLGGNQRAFLSVGTAALAWPKYALLVVALLAAAVPSVTWALRRLNTRHWLWLPGDYRRPEANAFKVGAAEPLMPDPSKVGICCSGGGVRSAAFNLGALQVLAESRRSAGAESPVYTRADHLVAVSGGSYVAAALAILGIRRGIEESPFQRRSAEERHLRLNPQYLAPRLRDKAGAVATVLLGFAVNLLLVGLLLFVATGPVGWATRLAHREPGQVTLRNVDWAAVLVPVSLVVLATLLARLPSIGGRLRRWLAAPREPLLIAAGLLLLVLVVVPGASLVVDWLRDREAVRDIVSAEWIGLLLGAGGLAAVLRSLVARNPSRFANLAAAIVVPVSAAAAALTLAVWHWERGLASVVEIPGLSRAWLVYGLALVVVLWALAGVTSVAATAILTGSAVAAAFVWRAIRGSLIEVAAPGSVPAWLAYGVAVAIVLWTFLAVDVTRWSLHPLYKRRLATAYALRRTGGRVVPIGDEERVPTLSGLVKDGEYIRPELIVAAAANVSDCRWAAAGTDAVSFTFGPAKVGIPGIAEIDTDIYEAVMEPRAADVDVMAAVAISGAALSPAMGKHTRRSLTALLALAGIRLGVWLPNPVWVTSNPTPWPEKVRPTYLFKEMLGRFDHDDRYLYVTDGGHWENLGIVELLRRGCTTIYCFDASGDTVSTFNAIGEAAAIAKAELGVQINVRPEAMRPVKPDRRSRRAADPLAADGRLSPVGHVAGYIRWPDGREEGHVVICKLALTETTPWDIKSYAERHPVFPNHSTLDQFFDGERFEAYRALGEYSAREAIEAFERFLEEEEERTPPLAPGRGAGVDSQHGGTDDD